MALVLLAAVLLLLTGIPAQLCAGASEPLSALRPAIAVATQNQYFGADLTPLAAAPPDQANAAFLKVLQNIAASDFPAAPAAKRSRSPACAPTWSGSRRSWRSAASTPPRRRRRTGAAATR